MKHGVQKNNFHFKDYSYERTFGTVDPKFFPDEYDADLGLTMPDQNKDGYPNGCTGYTTSEIAQDENGELFDPIFTYEKTLLLGDYPPGAPVKIRDSLKSARTFGVKRKKATDNELPLIRGAYFDVHKNGDYFDGIRSALLQNQLNSRTISAASPWFTEWLFPGSSGILKAPKKYVWDSQTVGHNYKITGWKLINGEPYLKIKPWRGSKVADKGWHYMSREVCNKTFNISGTALYIQANITPGDVATVKLDIQELILTFLRRLTAALA